MSPFLAYKVTLFNKVLTPEPITLSWIVIVPPEIISMPPDIVEVLSIKIFSEPIILPVPFIDTLLKVTLEP
ncbi:hypothetical protein OAI82_02125 [bacterium]|nr:hypothetical protein [bacterium]